MGITVRLKLKLMKLYFSIAVTVLALWSNWVRGQDSGGSDATIITGDPPIYNDSDDITVILDPTYPSGVTLYGSAPILIENTHIIGSPISISSEGGIETDNCSMTGNTPSLMPISAGSSIVMNGSTLGIPMNQASSSAGGNPGWALWVLTAGDQVSLSGLELLLMAGGLPDFDPSASYSWNVITAPNANLFAENLTVNLSQFYNSYNGVFSTMVTPSDVFLNYNPVPEPSTWALLVAGVIPAIFSCFVKVQSNRA